MKSHTESWGCSRTPGFASSMCEKSGGGLKRQTESWGCPPTLGFVTLISKRNLGGREKAQKKLRVPTNSWICHFDLQKKLGGGVKRHTESWGCSRTPGFATFISNKWGWEGKSTQKVEGAHYLLDLPLRFRKKIGGGCERAHRKLRVPINSWTSSSISEKWGGEWKGRQKAERAHQLLDLPLRFPKIIGGVCVWKSGKKVESAHQLLDFPLRFPKTWREGWKSTPKVEGAQELLDLQRRFP